MADFGDRSSRDRTSPGSTGGVVQRMPGKRSLVESRYPVQRRAAAEPAAAEPAAGGSGVGLPASLKSGAEAASGMAMDDVRVHYDSPKPAELGAHAYAQGTDIHLGPGQEQHLPHEAWHTVQQKQGRVEATTQAKSVGVNDDSALEQEADVMGDKIAGGAAAVGGAKAGGPAKGGAGAKAGGPAAGGVGAGAADAVEGGAAPAAAAEAGGGAEGEGSAAVAGSMTAEPAVQLKAATGGVVQLLKYKTVPVVISTLTSADEVNEHVKRFYRKQANKPIGDDADYEYDPKDLNELKTKLTELKEADIVKRHLALTTALLKALSTLATAADFTTQPPWNGLSPGQGTSKETFKGGSMAADETTVVSAWRSFLGAGPYTTKHPRTGATETGRVMSADGKRSIRYGDHETTGSKPNQHHYHEETWTHDSSANVINVDNKVQRVPVT